MVRAGVHAFLSHRRPRVRPSVDDQPIKACMRDYVKHVMECAFNFEIALLWMWGCSTKAAPSPDVTAGNALFRCLAGCFPAASDQGRDTGSRHTVAIMKIQCRVASVEHHGGRSIFPAEAAEPTMASLAPAASVLPHRGAAAAGWVTLPDRAIAVRSGLPEAVACGQMMRRPR